MSTSSSRVDIFLYFGGNYTSDGWCFTYDRQPVAAMRIPRSSTYAQFFKRIYQKIGVDSNEYLLKVSAKHSCQYLGRIKETLFPITNDDALSFLLDPEAEIPMLEVYVDAEQIHVEPPLPMSQQWGEINPQMSQQWGEANPQMSNQWGEYMNLLATPRLPSCSNTDYLAGTSNPDFGAGTSNLDFGAGTSNSEPEYYTPNLVTVTQGLDNIDFHYTEPTQSHTPLSENFIPNENDVEDPTADSFVNESDEASEPDEAEYPIPPEDGPDRVDINVMAATFAQRGAETSSEPTLPDMNTQPTFYRSIPFFEETFPEIPADSVDVPNLRNAKFYNKSEGRLDKGMLFKTKEELIEAVQDHSIRHARREYYVTESSKTKWKVLCKHSTEAAMDGNQQVLPLAFAIVDEETYPSWKWFLQQLSRRVIRGRRGMCLISDRHGGLIKAVREGSLLASWLGISIRKFNRNMEEIKKQDVKAFAYLDQINKEKWTASHDGGWRCGILTTNMSECINGVLKGARRLPINALVEITLERSVHYFRVRAIKGQKMLQNNQLWTDFACKMFISWQQKAVEHTVTKYSHTQQSASVQTRRQNRHGMNTHVVKIANRECSCGKWNQFGIPYSHAQKVCGAYNISAASMVKDYYDLMVYNNTYSKHFELVQLEDYWDDPNFQLVHDPTIRTVTRPGRNQTTLIHNEMDGKCE
ncbi:hypothetical protein Sango_2482000 [Sesamum angolense]|uniref:Zinc finger PMZ-type domain-containing protein n=1 Tax=Sesamum angolense TaxID=2727404 RepID=A0AAE1W3L1_9LAMI|nr:hypothetical protein Sango_2482000 [Sesamum angolense]